LCKKLAISGMWNISSVIKDDYIYIYIYIYMCVCVCVHKLLPVMLNLTYCEEKKIRTQREFRTKQISGKTEDPV